MKALTNGIIITENQIIYGKALLYDDKISGIVSVDDIPENASVTDVGGNMIIAGLIDIHIHGYHGFDISDGKTEEIEHIGKALLANGVTAWCPTTETVELKRIEEAFDAVRSASENFSKGKWNGARILGINCEGPFINIKKAGAQNPEFIIKPDVDFAIRNKDVLRLITVAPEEDKDFEFIQRVTRETDIVVSIGHTEASFEMTKAAINAGATHTTHLYNAMTPFGHREPGVIGAVLTDNRVSCELIADTFHVHPGLFKMTEALKKNKLVLITDCVTPGGMPDGRYKFGGQDVFVKGIECRLESGVISGSVLTLNKAIKNMVEYTDLPLYKIINMASLNPAFVIGENRVRGSLEVGKEADITVVNKDFDVCMTIVGGNVCYKTEV